MLGRIFLRRLDVLSVRPIINRCLDPTCSHRRLLSDSPAATAAAKDRRWVMLSIYGRRRTDDSSFVAEDANTVAESRTSKGRLVRVSFRCAAPPSSSYLYYDFPESARVKVRDEDRIRVAGAHGELVLLEMHSSRSYSVVDYFVYRSASPRRPPSLSLLPFPECSFDDPSHPWGDYGGIGLLRRGGNDLMVRICVDRWYDCDAAQGMVVFCVLRHGMRQWELMEPVPMFQYGLFRSPRNVICVGDRFLCCIWYSSGFMLCDMADEVSPKVRYVYLPPEVTRCSYGDDTSIFRFRRMGAVDDSSVRFISIYPNCCRSFDPDRDLYINDDEDCCCRECSTACWHERWHPRFVFTIRTWKMNFSMEEPMQWVEDGKIDGEEIWALPGYEGLPQAIPEWPVVCPGKPNVICFLVSNYHFTKDEEKLWMIQLNIDTKTLLSVAQYTNNDDYFYRNRNYHLPSEIQY